MHPVRCVFSSICSSALNSPAVAAAQSSRNFSCRPICHVPRLLICFQLVSCGRPPVQFFLAKLFADLLKAAVVMVADVRVSLIQLLGDFGECISLEEMQPQGLPLLLAQ